MMYVLFLFVATLWGLRCGGDERMGLIRVGLDFHNGYDASQLEY